MSTCAQNRDVAAVFNRDVKAFYTAKDVETFDSRSKELIFNNPISNDWELVELTAIDNNIINDYWLKYDAYNKELFLKKEDQIVKVPIAYFREFEVKSVSGNRKFINLLVNNAQEFLEVIYQDDSTLLKRFECKFLKANYNALLDGGNYNDKISVVESYFLKNKSGELFKIPRKKKQAIAFFKSQSFDLVKYISDEKLNVKEEQDLIRIIKFLNKEK